MNSVGGEVEDPKNESGWSPTKPPECRWDGCGEGSGSEMGEGGGWRGQVPGPVGFLRGREKGTKQEKDLKREMGCRAWGEGGGGGISLSLSLLGIQEAFRVA